MLPAHNRLRRNPGQQWASEGEAHSGSRFNAQLLPARSRRRKLRPPNCRLRFRPNGPTEDLFGKLDDTRFTLIVIGQPSPPVGVPELGDLMRIHEVPSDPANVRELARAHIPRPSFYLLRPDGHVGLAGTRWDAAAATRYVSERVHLAVTHS